MVILSVTCVALFLSFAYHFQSVYEKQADSHLSDVTSMSTSNISSLIEQIDQLSVSVLVDQVVQSNLRAINKNYGKESVVTNEAAISNQVRGSVFNIKDVVSLRIYSRSGDEVLVGTTNREYLEYSMSNEEIYQANGAAVWGMAGEEHYLCLGRAILSTINMKPIGHLVIICKNQYLGKQLKMVTNEYSGKVYLLDDKDHVVSCSESDQEGKKFPYRLSELKSRKERMIPDLVSGEYSYYYVGNTMENGWTLVTTISSRELTKGVVTSIVQMLILLILAVTVSVFLTLGAVRKLVAPTQKLLKSMSAFGQGQMDARVDIKTRDEIGQIGKTYNQMADNIQELLEKVYSLELSNKQAEIDFLKMQINPHFLYNSLDTISWLGFTSGNENISDISVSLAKLLRASINRADMVTVSEEMQLIDSYLLIQQYRFEDKIQVERKIDEAVYECYMPSFLLQPLIENSIIHGLEGRIGKGKLLIEIRILPDNYLQFVIADDGTGMEPEKMQELQRQFEDVKNVKSIGLTNVYRRLKLLYGEECCFQIRSAPEEGTYISFRIPVKKEPD